jgi:hypothetical protein
MPVFLVTWSASVGAGSTPWMFTVALKITIIKTVSKSQVRWKLPSVSPERRDLPLFSYFCIAHTPHEIVGAVLVQMARHLDRFFCAFWMVARLAAGEVVEAAEDPSGERFEGIEE